MIKVIEDNNKIFAKIIRSTYESKDCEFYTDNDDDIQFGVVTYPKNHKTGAHFHNYSTKKTNPVDEIFMVQYGSARIDFYNNEGVYIKSCEVNTGDIAILYKGGHNVVFYDDTKLFLIKKGAYDKDNDKTRIIGTHNLELVIEE